MELFSNRKLETREDDEEESLSLVDLPVNLSSNEPEPEKSKPTTDDFNFNLYNCSIFDESEMCSADDVFFQGQILPYRHSISSDTGISLNPVPTRYLLRSESMDHRSPCGMISSSRSSSINSQYSSSSGSGSINYFHSHPSPSPRIRTSTRTSNRYNSPTLSRRSNLWGVFRVGVVKTPEIELRDIKNRSINGNSRNNSRNSTSSQNSGNNNKTRDGKTKIDEKNKKKKIFFDFSGCKCSVSAINPVNCEAIEKGPRKTTSSRYRTFEWIKELSVECGPDSLES